MIPNIIICNRVTAQDLLPIRALNIVKFYLAKCSDCSHDVLISEASKLMLDQFPQLICVCLECVTIRLKNDPNIQLATTPKHLLELERIRLAGLRRLN